MESYIENENSGGRRRAVSALDISIILVLIAVIVLGVIRAGVIEKIAFRGSDCDLTVRIFAYPAGFEANFSSGDKVYLADGTLLGEIVSAKSSPSVLTLTNAGGEAVDYSYPEGTLSDIELRIRCSLEWKSDSWYTSGSLRMVYGETLVFYTSRAQCESVIVKIAQNEEAY